MNPAARFVTHRVYHKALPLACAAQTRAHDLLLHEWLSRPVVWIVPVMPYRTPSQQARIRVDSLQRFSAGEGRGEEDLPSPQPPPRFGEGVGGRGIQGEQWLPSPNYTSTERGTAPTPIPPGVCSESCETISISPGANTAAARGAVAPAPC